MNRVSFIASKFKLIAQITRRNVGHNRRINIGSQSEKERALQLKTGVPKEFELIYRAPMQNYMKVAKNVSTISTSLIVLISAAKLAADANYLSIVKEAQWFGLVAHENDIWVFGAGFLAINLVIRLFVSRFPLRIYKNVDRYIAVYDSQIPFRSTINHFQRGQVAEVSHALNPWKDSTYRLGKRTSLLLFEYFRTPAEFEQML